MTIDGEAAPISLYSTGAAIDSPSSAAYSSFQEEQLGSFTPGKRFDAVIWSQDLMTVPADEILQSKVKATLVDGRCVFGAVSGRS